MAIFQPFTKYTGVLLKIFLLYQVKIFLLLPF